MPRTCTGDVCVRSRFPSFQPKRILHVARRMFGGNVQRIEVVIFGLNFRPIQHREAQ